MLAEHTERSAESYGLGKGWFSLVRRLANGGSVTSMQIAALEQLPIPDLTSLLTLVSPGVVPVLWRDTARLQRVYASKPLGTVVAPALEISEVEQPIPLQRLWTHVLGANLALIGFRGRSVLVPEKNVWMGVRLLTDLERSLVYRARKSMKELTFEELDLLRVLRAYTLPERLTQLDDQLVEELEVAIARRVVEGTRSRTTACELTDVEKAELLRALRPSPAIRDDRLVNSCLQAVVANIDSGVQAMMVNATPYNPGWLGKVGYTREGDKADLVYGVHNVRIVVGKVFGGKVDFGELANLVPNQLAELLMILHRATGKREADTSAAEMARAEELRTLAERELSGLVVMAARRGRVTPGISRQDLVNGGGSPSERVIFEGLGINLAELQDLLIQAVCNPRFSQDAWMPLDVAEDQLDAVKSIYIKKLHTKLRALMQNIRSHKIANNRERAGNLTPEDMLAMAWKSAVIKSEVGQLLSTHTKINSASDESVLLGLQNIYSRAREMYPIQEFSPGITASTKDLDDNAEV